MFTSELGQLRHTMMGLSTSGTCKHAAATAGALFPHGVFLSRVQKDGETLSIDFQKDGESGLINNQLDNVTFKVHTGKASSMACKATDRSFLWQYDGVLNNVSQEAIYSTCAQAAVDNVLAGYNATIFCYGQVKMAETSHAAAEGY